MRDDHTKSEGLTVRRSTPDFSNHPSIPPKPQRLCYVLMCKSCGKIQSCLPLKKLSDYVFKCRTCGKTTKLFQKKKFSIRLKHLFHHQNPRMCALWIGEYEKRKAVGRGRW